MVFRNPNIPPKTVHQIVAAADVDTDASGDVAVVIGDLNFVEGAKASLGAGYRAEVQGIADKNTVTFRVYADEADGLGGAAQASPAEASHNNIAIMYITAWGR